MEEKKRGTYLTKKVYAALMLTAVCIVFVYVASACVAKHQPTAPEEKPAVPTTDVSVITENIERGSDEENFFDEAQYAQNVRDAIDRVVSDWSEGIISFEEATAMLSDIQAANTDELAEYAEAQRSFITVENDGNTLLDLSQRLITSKEFVHVFANLNTINPDYSKYDLVLEVYRTCEEQVLQYVANPASKEEFEDYIKLLEECGGLYESESITARKDELSDELVVFLDISEIIDAATVQFDSGNVAESLALLALGLQEYPADDRMSTAIVNYRDHYVIAIAKQSVELCEKEEYKEALQIVEAAIEEYDCGEFRMLREAIKEEKSFLYRLKNDIVGVFTSLTDDWSEEEFDVKQAADEAGAYIMKSGKKILLGDYTDENVTLLSFGGNVAASMLGVDLAFDLRDLSYDITHWGEDEYFAVWLAADVVALLPVIGVVKYLSHFKSVADGVDAASELVDSAGDVGKNADNASEMLDTISDVTKIGDDIAEVIDNAKSATNVVEAAKDVVSDVVKEYALLDTKNQRLLGMVHEKSGVEFVLSKIDLSDGRKLMGVFPRFDSIVDIELPKDLYKADFYSQQKECMEQLQSKLKNPFSKLREEFTEEQIEDIMNGILPDGFTWHHNEQEGLMQLVDTVVHTQTSHTGGMSIWGRGY